MKPGPSTKTPVSFTDLIGINYPIIQGPFGGGFSSVELTTTVSNLGGLGSFGAHQLSSEEIQSLCVEIERLTTKPYAINLWVSNTDKEMQNVTKEGFLKHQGVFKAIYKKFEVEPPQWRAPEGVTFEQQVEGILRASPRVFSFVFGIPSKAILTECRKQNILTLGAATTIEEALALDESGVDLILATGFEAGGHRPSFLKASEDSLIGTFALVPAIRDAVSTPVIAAGGIADRRGVRAALALGADAVQVGSAFLACDESTSTKSHKKKLLENKNGETILSRAYSGRLARFFPNKVTEIHHMSELATLPFPAQGWVTQPIKKAAITTSDVDYMPLYASQISPLIKHSSTAEVMRELIEGLE